MRQQKDTKTPLLYEGGGGHGHSHGSGSRLESEDLTEEIWAITVSPWLPIFVKTQSKHIPDLKNKRDDELVECCEQVSLFLIPFTKTHRADKYTVKEVKSSLRYLRSQYKYEMAEDVHQVANYLEMKAKQREGESDHQICKEYERMSKGIVLLGIVIQIILVALLAKEVLQKEIYPSANYLPLRLVLLGFMYTLFKAEQTSIAKTNQFISLGYIGYFLTFMNFFRQCLAHITFGIAAWQVFSTTPDETSAVEEIMDFAALLIVIELDEFLMCYPSQVYANKHFASGSTKYRTGHTGPKDFLEHEFSNDQIQTLVKIKCLGYFTTWLNMVLRIIEFAVKLMSKVVILVIILMVNFEKWSNFRPLQVMVGEYNFYADGCTLVGHFRYDTCPPDVVEYSADDYPQTQTNTVTENGQEVEVVVEDGPCYMGMFYCE